MTHSDRRSVVVCSHVLNRTHPMLYGRRDAPSEAVDSGWQFVCMQFEETAETGRLIAVDELLVREPELAPYINEPPGAEVWRAHAKAAWTLRRNASET